MPTVDELTGEWRDAGIRPGDLVLVHSSIKRTLARLRDSGQPATPGAILESFVQAVGPDGTLLFPLFNFEFTKDVAFDIRTSPSHMGALTETARLDPRSLRTGHPIYSFAIIGPRAAEFTRVLDPSAYGADSPFGLLHRLGGKIAILDLPDQHSVTFYHHVEQMLAVPYRYHKEFEGDYVDAAGVTSRRRFGIFVRDLDRRVETFVDPMGELLWERGLYTGDRSGVACGLRVISARALFEATAEVIRGGRAEGLLYRIGEAP